VEKRLTLLLPQKCQHALTRKMVWAVEKAKVIQHPALVITQILTPLQLQEAPGEILPITTYSHILCSNI